MNLAEDLLETYMRAMICNTNKTVIIRCHQPCLWTARSKHQALIGSVGLRLGLFEGRCRVMSFCRSMQRTQLTVWDCQHSRETIELTSTADVHYSELRVCNGSRNRAILGHRTCRYTDFGSEQISKFIEKSLAKVFAFFAVQCWKIHIWRWILFF